jgi:hypothetical protein
MLRDRFIPLMCGLWIDCYGDRFGVSPTSGGELRRLGPHVQQVVEACWACYLTVRSKDMPRILWPSTGQYTL